MQLSKHCFFGRPKSMSFELSTNKDAHSGRRAMGAVALLILFCCATWAQQDTGGITGTVRDSSKAVVSAATVRVVDVDRGTEFVTTTNSDGEYLASPLKVGRYTVAVEKAGFKKTVAGPTTSCRCLRQRPVTTC